MKHSSAQPCTTSVLYYLRGSIYSDSHKTIGCLCLSTGRLFVTAPLIRSSAHPLCLTQLSSVSCVSLIFFLLRKTGIKICFFAVGRKMNWRYSLAHGEWNGCIKIIKIITTSRAHRSFNFPPIRNSLAETTTDWYRYSASIAPC